ncbi:3'-5' exonuclease [Paenibacillus rhizophilus]|uniref:DNA polymerase III subunit epsilon n=1 Tax=Paenibacillus rhizophilus TaxID=1850366 RepID=A0A3N9PX04_9BACL|nr:3'-5' exonuclease [Paenibacillus rhizophilus]RQW09726.1 DNA polymerase III subunit epsilon [Paenibacillus rhizophilus]
MDFVAIDFETANAGRASACALGLVEVKGGRIVSEQAWLINPEQSFDRRNIAIHGITPEMVAGQPTFRELWPVIEPLILGKNVVAHNASFDMSVLRYGLDQCSLPYPSFQYWCTYLLAKKMLAGFGSYRLNILAEYFGIPLRHHDALEDARTAAVILLKLSERAGHSGLTALAEDLGCRIGTLHTGGYTPFSIPARKPSGKKTKAAGKKSGIKSAAAPAESAQALLQHNETAASSEAPGRE